MILLPLPVIRAIAAGSARRAPHVKSGHRTWSDNAHKFERQSLAVSQEAWALFLDPSQRMYGILWSLCGVCRTQAKSIFVQ